MVKRNCKELKRIARENLSICGYALPMRAFILSSLIASLFELPFSMLQTTQITFSIQNIIYYIAQLLIHFVSILLTCGQYRIHFAIAQNKKATLTDLFFYIKNMPDRYILARFIYFGFIFICMLPIFIGVFLLFFGKSVFLSVLWIVIGTILTVFFSLNFDLLFFVLIQHPEFSIREGFTQIRTLMKGNIGKYFYLQLSFLGMILLVLLSFGLALLWVQPYMTQTITVFYFELTGQLDKIEVYKKKEAQKETLFEQYV